MNIRFDTSVVQMNDQVQKGEEPKLNLIPLRFALKLENVTPNDSNAHEQVESKKNQQLPDRGFEEKDGRYILQISLPPRKGKSGSHFPRRILSTLSIPPFGLDVDDGNDIPPLVHAINIISNGVELIILAPWPSKQFPEEGKPHLKLVGEDDNLRAQTVEITQASVKRGEKHLDTTICLTIDLGDESPMEFPIGMRLENKRLENPEDQGPPLGLDVDDGNDIPPGPLSLIMNGREFRMVCEIQAGVREETGERTQEAGISENVGS